MSFRDGITRSTKIDQLGRFINVDDVIEALCRIQRINHANVLFKVRPTDEYTGEYIKSGKMKDEPNKNTLSAILEDRPERNMIIEGEFILKRNENKYDPKKLVCGYCSKLGYKNKYKSFICDSCTDCEGCLQFENGCKGCLYSVYFDGTYYRDKLPEEDVFSQHDISIFHKLDENKPDKTRRKSEAFYSSNYV